MPSPSSSQKRRPPPSPSPSPSAVATDVTCRGCGYDLSRVPDGRCPECGRPYDHDRDESVVRGTTALARWGHRQRHPDYGGFLPEWLAEALKSAQDRLGHVDLVVGLLLPLLPLWIGVEAIATRTTWLPARRMRLELEDQNAVLLGAAWICLAAAFHLHFIWGRTESGWRVAQPLAILSAIAATAGLVFVIGGKAFTMFA